MNYVAKKGEFDELVIVATAVILLVAGYDTTGSTMSCVCYHIAKNPEVQERLREEVEEVSGGDLSEDITYDDLHDMTYLDQVICETLRFHNPAGINQRNAHRDYKVPGHDFNLLIHHGMGQDPRLHSFYCFSLLIIFLNFFFFSYLR